MAADPNQTFVQMNQVALRWLQERAPCRSPVMPMSFTTLRLNASAFSPWEWI